MKRLVIMTIGKTHSGKTTFGKKLEEMLPTSIVIDQDNHATFLHTHYPKLIPEHNPFKLKILLSQFILNYAITETDAPIIISSANLSKNGRNALLEQFFPQDMWTRIYVYFDYSNETLHQRIKHTTRSTTIFRDTTMTFEHLIEKHAEQLEPPTVDEVDYLLHVNETQSIEYVIEKIYELIHVQHSC